MLIDLNGTLHVENEAIPGSIEALRRLRSQLNASVRFVTNTTKESRHKLVQRLVALGFDNLVPEADIFTSLLACRKIVESRNLRPLLLLDDAALSEFDGCCTEDPNCVIVGLAPNKFDFHHLNAVYRMLSNDSSMPLIAIHKARYFKQKDGLSLGPGCFITGLEYSLGRAAEVVGKPEREFFMTAVKDMNLYDEIDKCWMIGDDIRDDIISAISMGMHGILVQTGKYRSGDEHLIDPEMKDRFHLAKDFSDAIDIIMRKN